MKFEIEVNSKVLSVELSHRKRIKHCYLRVVNEHSLQIRANHTFTLNDAKKLVENKRSWIEKKLKLFKPSQKLQNNQFYFLGHIEEIFEEHFDEIEYYRQSAKEILPGLVDKHAKRMQLFPSSLKFRNNKSTWGSCNYKNGINLNINLMKYPLEAIEYVIIHELAHIKHKNHSRAFWNLVQEFCPNYKEHASLLKGF